MPQLPLFALQVERYEQQQHHTSGRGTTPAPLPYAGAAQLPAFQLRAQPLQGQGAAAEHVLGGSQEVWQQEGIMPGLQAVTGGLSLRGLQPALQDGTMLALEGTNPMLGSSMLLDSPGGLRDTVVPVWAQAIKCTLTERTMHAGSPCCWTGQVAWMLRLSCWLQHHTEVMLQGHASRLPPAAFVKAAIVCEHLEHTPEVLGLSSFVSVVPAAHVDIAPPCCADASGPSNMVDVCSTAAPA